MRAATSGSGSKPERSSARRPAASGSRAAASPGSASSERPRTEEFPGHRATGGDAGGEPLQVADRAERASDALALVRPLDEFLHGVEAGRDLVGDDERSQQAPAQQTRPHRGPRAVDEGEKRRALAGAQGLHEFEVPPGHLVEVHHASGPVHARRPQVVEAGRPHLVQVTEEGAARREEKRVARRVEAEAGRGGDPEPLPEPLVPERSVEAPGGPRGHVPGSGRRLRLLGDHDLGGLESPKFVVEIRGGDLAKLELAGREVDGGEPERGVSGDRDDVVVAARREELVLEDRARSDDLDDVPLHDPPGLRRILELLADRHATAHFEQAGDVLVHGLHGDAREGDVPLSAVVPGGEGESQQAAPLLRVLEEHLVEVADPEEEE